MGPPREAEDLLAEAVPLLLSAEASLGVGGGGLLHPSSTVLFFICGKWSFELLMRD